MAQADREALGALYNATGGPNWKRAKNWNTGADLSEWHGITTNDHGRVVGLALTSNNLQGSIPPELGELAALQYLDLSDNQLTGHIPRQLGDLGALRYLALNDNKLDGHIPPQLGQLGALQSLSLGGNKLDGPIPRELGNLAVLQYLNLQLNELSGPIPKELGELSRLEKLWLSGNNLTGPIPKELGELSRLEKLWLYGNNLTGPIPPELGQLAALTSLDLDNNQLTGPIPKELGALSALRQLWLSDNQLSGPIPRELGNLAVLQYLNLEVNELSGPIPEELGKLTALKELYLGGNKLSGPIPPELGKLEALKALYLYKNELSGAIPAQLGALNKLEWLDLSNNQLSGGPQEGETLDEWKRRLQKMESLLPSELPPLPGLEGITQGNAKAPGARGETLDESRRRLLKMDNLLRSELPSLPALKGITQGNPDALGEVKSIIETSAGAGVHPGPVPSERDNLRELEGLVQMAYTLGKLTSKYTEEEDALGKKLARTPFQKAYVTAVRSGLNKAYYAASVVDSGLVSTSKTGRMGKIGKVFKFLSRVPFAGWLAGLAGALFTVGDHYVQTLQLAKIANLASDSEEFGQLAKRVAEGLAGCLSHGTTTGGPAHSAAGMGGERGGSESSQGLDTFAVDTDENIMEYFVECAANVESTADGAGAGTLDEQAGRRLGKQHCKELLKGVKRDRLQGAGSLDEKVERLIRIIFPEYVQSPAWTSAPAGSFEPERMVALGVALMEMKTENETRQAELEKLRAANAVLQGKVAALEKRLQESRRGFGGSTDAASLEARVAELEKWKQGKKGKLRCLFCLC